MTPRLYLLRAAAPEPVALGLRALSVALDAMAVRGASLTPALDLDASDPAAQLPAIVRQAISVAVSWRQTAVTAAAAEGHRDRDVAQLLRAQANWWESTARELRRAAKVAGVDLDAVTT